MKVPPLLLLCSCAAERGEISNGPGFKKKNHAAFPRRPRPLGLSTGPTPACREFQRPPEFAIGVGGGDESARGKRGELEDLEPSLAEAFYIKVCVPLMLAVVGIGKMCARSEAFDQVCHNPEAHTYTSESSHLATKDFHASYRACLDGPHHPVGEAERERERRTHQPCVRKTLSHVQILLEMRRLVLADERRYDHKNVPARRRIETGRHVERSRHGFSGVGMSPWCWRSCNRPKSPSLRHASRKEASGRLVPGCHASSSSRLLLLLLLLRVGHCITTRPFRLLHGLPTDTLQCA